MLELDFSFLWIFFLIWILYGALNHVFFKPVGRIIHERERKAIADSTRQEKMVTEIESRTRSVEEQLNLARKAGQRIREEWGKDGERARAGAIAEARERASKLMEETISRLEGEIGAAERELEAQVSVFSDKIRQAYL